MEPQQNKNDTQLSQLNILYYGGHLYDVIRHAIGASAVDMEYKKLSLLHTSKTKYEIKDPILHHVKSREPERTVHLPLKFDVHEGVHEKAANLPSHSLNYTSVPLQPEIQLKENFIATIRTLVELNVAPDYLAAFVGAYGAYMSSALTQYNTHDGHLSPHSPMPSGNNFNQRDRNSVQAMSTRWQNNAPWGAAPSVAYVPEPNEQRKKLTVSSS
jgi:hypothetical protein